MSKIAVVGAGGAASLAAAVAITLGSKSTGTLDSVPVAILDEAVVQPVTNEQLREMVRAFNPHLSDDTLTDELLNKFNGDQRRALSNNYSKLLILREEALALENSKVERAAKAAEKSAAQQRFAAGALATAAAKRQRRAAKRVATTG